MKTSTLSWIAGRALLGGAFVILGGEAALEPGGRPGVAGPLLAKIRNVAPILPDDDEVLVRLNGGAQALGGAMIATGVLPGPAALAVAASLVPTTVAGHAFWAIADPAASKAQRVQVIKNAALLGGLLLVAARSKNT